MRLIELVDVECHFISEDDLAPLCVVVVAVLPITKAPLLGVIV